MEHPWIINLELTNACNIECVFCDHPVFKKERRMRMGEMEDGVLQKILDDVEGHRFHELGLVGLGEPTLAKRLEQHLQRIARHAESFTRISLNSNLVSLTPQKADMLLESCVNVYTFSINASNREAYRRMMVRDQFDVVISNFRAFLERRLRCPAPLPRVDVQVFESEHSSLEELRETLAGVDLEGIHFFTRKVYSKPVIQDGCEEVEIHRPDTGRYPCWDIYTRLYIDQQGYVYPCTIGNDSYRETSNLCIGNVAEAPLVGIFNNKALTAARKRAELGELPFPECEKCNIWSLTPNNFDWSDEQTRWIRKPSPVRAYGLTPSEA